MISIGVKPSQMAYLLYAKVVCIDTADYVLHVESIHLFKIFSLTPLAFLSIAENVVKVNMFLPNGALAAKKRSRWKHFIGIQEGNMVFPPSASSAYLLLKDIARPAPGAVRVKIIVIFPKKDLLQMFLLLTVWCVLINILRTLTPLANGVPLVGWQSSGMNSIRTGGVRMAHVSVAKHVALYGLHSFCLCSVFLMVAC